MTRTGQDLDVPCGDEPAHKPDGDEIDMARLGPTASRVVLGCRLRRRREASGISRETAAYAIRASQSKMSRLECGRVGFKPRDVADLLTLYGVPEGRERSVALALAEQANQPHWWDRHSLQIPSWFQPYLGLEETASQIRGYQADRVPDLLQTPDYARALMGPGASAADIEDHVELLRGRQQRLLSHPHQHLWVVIEEAALLRPHGGREVHRRQLDRLAKLSTHPNIALQILPLRRPAQPPTPVPFTILRFPDPDLPDLVYVPHLTGAAYLSSRFELDHYRRTINRLSHYADPASATADRLRAL